MAAPEVERLHAVDHAQYTLWVFAVPMLAATLIEAPLALLSDRWQRRTVLAGALLGLALSLGLCALAHSAWLLAVGLSLAGATSGVACGAAQGELVAKHPGGAHRALSRWIAFAAAGDALTPLALAAALWFGGTHRSTLAALAVGIGLSALFTLRRAPTNGSASEASDDEPAAPLMAAVKAAAKRPRLWFLLCAASICGLLDEVVVALAALRLDEHGWPAHTVAAALSGLSAFGILGALLLERLLAHRSPYALMLCAGIGSLTALGLFIVAPSAAVACAALCLLGLCAAAHYPLVQATAFEVMPNQPGVVNALGQVFVLLDTLLPLAVGALAERYGLGVGLASLALEPLVILIVGLSGLVLVPLPRQRH